MNCLCFLPLELFWGLVHTSLEERRICGPSHFWVSQPAGCWDYFHGFQPVNAWKHLLQKGSLARGRHLSNSAAALTLHFQIMRLLENDLLQEQFIKLNTCHYAMQNSWSNQMSGIYIFKKRRFSISSLAGILSSKRPRETRSWSQSCLGMDQTTPFWNC